MVTKSEKIIYYTEVYLHFMKEATASQITGFLRRAPFKFIGGKPSKVEVKGILTSSSKFEQYKNTSGDVMYKLKEGLDAV